MKKLPTLFERDFAGDRRRVLRTPTIGAEWVFAGEGVATLMVKIKASDFGIEKPQPSK